jgi:hypothetical protein
MAWRLFRGNGSDLALSILNCQTAVRLCHFGFSRKYALGQMIEAVQGAQPYSTILGHAATLTVLFRPSNGVAQPFQSY